MEPLGNWWDIDLYESHEWRLMETMGDDSAGMTSSLSFGDDVRRVD